MGVGKLGKIGVGKLGKSEVVTDVAVKQYRGTRDLSGLKLSKDDFVDVYLGGGRYSSEAVDIVSNSALGYSLNSLVVRGKEGGIVRILHVQEHHIIPQSTKSHPIWEIAGVSIDDAINMINLPESSINCVIFLFPKI